MKISPIQIQEISDLMEFYNSVFINANVGSSLLNRNQKRILKRFGIALSPVDQQTHVDYVYKFGMLASSLKYKRTKDFDFKGLKSFIKSGNFLPLSDLEKHTLDVLKHQMYKDVTQLKNRQISDLYQLSIESSQKDKYQQIIQREAMNAVNERMSIKQFSKVLSDKASDWVRDFDKVADFVMHSAYQHGKAMSLVRQYGTNVKVWYMVKKDACKHCKRIYIKNTRTNEPRVFQLLEVLNNGSNIGRKMDDLRATAYSLHVFCRCEMEVFDENTVWDQQKQLFIQTRNNYGVTRKSKIKITNNGT